MVDAVRPVQGKGKAQQSGQGDCRGCIVSHELSNVQGVALPKAGTHARHLSIIRVTDDKTKPSTEKTKKPSPYA